MSNSKSNFISFKGESAIVEVSDGDTRTVTPDNPLMIDYSPASFDDVDIQGGQIYTTVETTVTFKKLTKTS